MTLYNYYCHLLGKDAQGVKTWLPLNVMARNEREARYLARLEAEKSAFKIYKNSVCRMAN